METAPRDGTVIEVRCTYGVAPWYGIYRWGDKITVVQDGITHEMHGQPRWVKVGDECSGFLEDQTFSWRPVTGMVSSYVDPTGGRQDDPAYWRAAVARKYGLPESYFEQKPSLLRRWFGW